MARACRSAAQIHEPPAGARRSRNALSRRRRAGALRRAVLVVLIVAGQLLGVAAPARAESFVPITGAGSTWSEIALKDWAANVVKNNMRVNYEGTGSSIGRSSFRNSTVDFAVSEIPYGVTDAGAVTTDPPPGREHAYMPIVAGGTSFMYNLVIGGKRVTDLRLSGTLVTKIFTAVITEWNHPDIKAENPHLSLPARKIVPVIRSDGSGTTAQFTMWMAARYPSLWNAYCAKSNRAVPCGVTSQYPTLAVGNTFATGGSSSAVSAYVSGDNAQGSITYVELAYANLVEFPVARIKNEAGFYVGPTARNVAVALLKAKIHPVTLVQDLNQVYADPDPRTYPLSSYSYMIIPLKEEGGFNRDKGYTLAKFANYFLCEGQQQAEDLGYSPLPINLVEAGMLQVKRIPGAPSEQIVVRTCNNPTFSTNGTNTLATTAPYPAECNLPVCVASRATAGPNGSSPGPGSSAAPAGSADPNASNSPQIDPETGEVINGGGGAGGPYVDGVPVALGAQLGWQMRHTLMVLGGLLLAGLVFGPPLMSRRLRDDRKAS